MENSSKVNVAQITDNNDTTTGQGVLHSDILKNMSILDQVNLIENNVHLSINSEIIPTVS
jgi:hypothetical protein